MCNSKMRGLVQIDGRPVLQPASNRVVIEPNKPMKNIVPSPITLPKPTLTTNDAKLSPLPKLKREKAVLKRGIDPNGLNSSGEKPPTPRSAASKPPVVAIKKSKKVAPVGQPGLEPVVVAAGTIAAAQRKQASLMQQQRKMRIAHYGRTAEKLQGKEALVDSANVVEANQDEKRCSFITSNSDPLYLAYHDEEWGAPVHDDRALFELLVLSGFQVGMDWTTILKRRHEFRAAFSGFAAEEVCNFTEKQITTISLEYGIDIGRVRGVADNANRVLEVGKEFGSLSNYLWGFVNHKPLVPGYRSCRKIPVKTSKSDSISRDLIRRGFRFVGPTVVLSFMQAAGLTNDHLLSCPRHAAVSLLSRPAAELTSSKYHDCTA